ncbi:hypothetical protein DAEQUDRAFT_695988 [Daedalea quercina L-15889]|uniref:3beta-hydroxysteroid 3-dehydrogenase n=1 Tax=Daedalea quercina L-15889 TaxID=1314783 RepID=A0A165MVX2_9APHY|nr:hypothetical protein DAEQUDRAFT_695988 [Daedalea quercina L-15889]
MTREERKCLIVLVTGANGGIGFGTCHRLLVQLSQRHPPDAQPYFTSVLPSNEQSPVEPTCDLTIIMACRSVQRAEEARQKLYNLLDTHINTIPSNTPEYDYATEFRMNVRLEIHRLDLSVIRSVLDFSKELLQKYPYISHIICNAGLATYSHLDFLVFFKQCYDSPLKAVKHPMFNIQKVGVLSSDNLGMVWQCNIFGHYVLFRSLQPLLSAWTARCPSEPARVLWMSSVDAMPTYDPDTDPQLTTIPTSYQASKAQLDLLVRELSKQAKAEGSDVQHYVVTPGITATNVAATLLRPYILELLMIAFFYFCRCIGSPHVLFSTYKASVAVSHITLMPSRFLPSTADTHSVECGKPSGSYGATTNGSAQQAFPKFSAANERWGKEYILIEPITVWEEHPDEGARAVERCERLYQAFLEKEKTESGVNGKANGAANGHA